MQRISAVQRDIGALATQLPTATQRGRIDLQRILGDQIATIGQRACDGGAQCLACRRAATLVHIGCADLQIATGLHAASVVQQCRSGQGDVALARQHTARGVVEATCLHRQIAACKRLRCVTERAGCIQNKVAPALCHTRQRQIALAADVQIAPCIQLAAAVDGRAVQRDRSRTLQHRILAGCQCGGAQRSITASLALGSKCQSTLCL
ncbi:hypothetical protein GGR79_001601 [Xanthomonas arboricola]|nr:hypothetical protein [Xanthomonas arboricola]